MVQKLAITLSGQVQNNEKNYYYRKRHRYKLSERTYNNTIDQSINQSDNQSASQPANL